MRAESLANIDTHGRKTKTRNSYHGVTRKKVLGAFLKIQRQNLLNGYQCVLPNEVGMLVVRKKKVTHHAKHFKGSPQRFGYSYRLAFISEWNAIKKSIVLVQSQSFNDYLRLKLEDPNVDYRSAQ